GAGAGGGGVGAGDAGKNQSDCAESRDRVALPDPGAGAGGGVPADIGGCGNSGVRAASSGARHFCRVRATEEDGGSGARQTNILILSEAKDLLSRARRKSRSFASLRMTIQTLRNATNCRGPRPDRSRWARSR